MAIKTIHGREEIKVYLEDKGLICIEQNNEYRDENDMVIIHPDDLNVLIEHLRAVYDESLNFVPNLSNPK